MSGPKHLWSGDWERESGQSAQDPVGGRLSALVAPSATAAAGSGPAGTPATDARDGRMPPRTRLLVAASSITALAAAAVVVLVLAGPGTRVPAARRAVAHVSTSHGATSTPAAVPTPTTPASVLAGPTINWLGMQIVTGPTGAVVNTVKLGSLADAAGFEPGDQIEQIDGYAIASVRAIRRVAARIPLGHSMLVSVLRSTVTVQLSLPMLAQPTFHS
ncbi:PDZ domain-containing protein [Conexibacter sp. S30A1]|uniref:PDZ domain-containing protein n=1 Tax=Conexibacter sp. S30A1 TaxID=2937800 RepID=UPI002010086B|nr:PDZ domain-containing protein [Conexibacter sp. S30A1]